MSNDNYTDDTPICKPLNPSYGFAMRHEVNRLGLCWRCGKAFTEAHMPSGDRHPLELRLDKEAVSFREMEQQPEWQTEGDYVITAELMNDVYLALRAALTEPAEPLDSHQHDTCDCKPMSDELLAALADEPVEGEPYKVEIVDKNWGGAPLDVSTGDAVAAEPAEASGDSEPAEAEEGRG